MLSHTCYRCCNFELLNTVLLFFGGVLKCVCHVTFSRAVVFEFKFFFPIAFFFLERPVIEYLLTPKTGGLKGGISGIGSAFCHGSARFVGVKVWWYGHLGLGSPVHA